MPINILAIDTVTDACSVALNLRGDIIRRFEIAEPAKAKPHSQRILGMVEEVLREADCTLSQLDALAVDIGPGAFTGVRIGIGVSQGLAYGARLTVVPVSSLETLAWQARAESPTHTAILPALDARMGQVYYALYDGADDRDDDGMIIPPSLAAPSSVTVGDMKNVKNIVGIGSGWDEYAAEIQTALNQPALKWLANRHPDAAAVSQLAAARGVAGAVSPLNLTAAYIRDEVADVK